MTGKKAAIFLVYRVLEKYSDKKNCLTYQEIIDHISSEYDVSLERKSVAANIQLLRDDLGYDIQKGKRGWYLEQRLFEPSEINYLTAEIMTAKAITGNYASQLSKKIISVLSEHYQKNYRHVLQCMYVDRSNNCDFFDNIDRITHAFRHNRKIRFEYITYDDNFNQISKKDKNGATMIYEVSPLYIVNSRGLPYLLTIFHRDNKPVTQLTPFRIDYMKKVTEVKPSTRELANTLPKYKDNKFKLPDYVNSHVYMFGSDDVEDITVKIKNTEGIKFIKEWFGNSAHFKKVNGDMIADIRSDTQTFFYWMMQYSEHFILLSPKSLVEKVRNAAKNILDTYK